MRKRLTTIRPARDAAPGQSEHSPSRRAFLRRAGVAGALTAGLAGGADLLGMSAAGAATRRSAASQRGRQAAKPSCLGYNCTLDYGGCGQPCHPSGHCCYYCVGLGRIFTTCASTCAPSFYKCA